MKKEKIFPVLLAAGSGERLGFPQALGRFGGKSALDIAVRNCAGLERPIIVLGAQARRIRSHVPRGARVVVNRRWRRGQLSSLLAGLRHVPLHAAFMAHPVDHPLLTRKVILRLALAFESRTAGQKIVLPRYGRRAGHPTIFAPEIRRELQAARTARAVVYREKRRIKYVPVRTAAIWEQFDSPESYERCRRKFLARRRSKKKSKA